MNIFIRRSMIFIAFFTLIGLAGYNNTASTIQVYAESAAKSSAVTNKKVEVDSTAAHREQFLNICKEIGINLNKKGFRYGYSSRARSYSSALKHRRVATCATYVSWCLQEYGVLPKGKLFYGKGRGLPSKTKWDKKKIQVVRVYKTTKHANLKPGDVICWATGKAHVCVYAGKNSQGKRTWYDAGRHQSTYGHCAGSRYKVVSARYNKYLENRLVGYVIRIK
ncbi:MAG: CHAP domain-containing protein [Eubacterium sp.]|nr:CHAP domain-containing protein [Eubacterium sp.]